MQDIINSLSTYGYIILFLYTLGGGMVAIIAAGVLSYAGKMDLSISITVAAISNAIGDTLLFYLSRYNKGAIMPYLKGHKRKLAYAGVLTKKHGDKIIFFKKFIYGLKTLVPVAIGLTKYPFYKFSVINVISSIAWACILGILSYWAGDFFIKASDYISDHGYIMPVAMLCLFGGIWYFLKKVTKRKEVK
ncbi:DedA family protein [Campylobacter curvus]|uniref:DedA family protein n=1 Tax=Campylobacter curvus TaxID=200 RepID=UPI0003805B40|nr:DedA family protein [Campylobacter curvus]QKF61119.1 DedA family membrane protein, type III (SNARE domain) [Campylobacter curvus]UEB49437.1 DedA family protein [Campylobacter curvus]